MGSPMQPMRLLLSPRHKLSPSTHTLTAASHRSGMIIKSTSQSRAKKKLEYSIKPTINANASNVKINIFDVSPTIKHNKISLLVNTPNKYDILKSGLSSLRDLDILGKGGFGTVVRGSYAGREVAVKVIKTKQIMKEQNALTLSHENIVRTIDVIMKNDSHSIIVMEYLPDAQVLQSIINNEKFVLPFGDVIRWVVDIINGLMYCHSNNLLHLDLKPNNVLVTSEGCKICDFGNSCLVGTLQHINEGTVQYTSPELLSGKSPTYKNDTYSLGILMWQLRYRENPYEFLECRDSIIYNVVKYGLRPHAASGHEILDEYAALYRSCWQSDELLRPELNSVKSDLLTIENLL